MDVYRQQAARADDEVPHFDDVPRARAQQRRHRRRVVVVGVFTACAMLGISALVADLQPARHPLPISTARFEVPRAPAGPPRKLGDPFAPPDERRVEGEFSINPAAGYLATRPPPDPAARRW